LFLTSQSNRNAIFCTRHCFPIKNQIFIFPVPVPVNLTLASNNIYGENAISSGGRFFYVDAAEKLNK